LRTTRAALLQSFLHMLRMHMLRQGDWATRADTWLPCAPAVLSPHGAHGRGKFVADGRVIHNVYFFRAAQARRTAQSTGTPVTRE
jgi:hypothetical protein